MQKIKKARYDSYDVFHPRGDREVTAPEDTAIRGCPRALAAPPSQGRTPRPVTCTPGPRQAPCPCPLSLDQPSSHSSQKIHRPSQWLVAAESSELWTRRSALRGLCLPGRSPGNRGALPVSRTKDASPPGLHHTASDQIIPTVDTAADFRRFCRGRQDRDDPECRKVNTSPCAPRKVSQTSDRPLHTRTAAGAAPSRLRGSRLGRF